MSIIRMKYPFLDEIAKYAKEHLPEEACGLIAGSEDENGRLITKVYYLTIQTMPRTISQWIQRSSWQP